MAVYNTIYTVNTVILHVICILSQLALHFPHLKRKVSQTFWPGLSEQQILIQEKIRKWIKDSVTLVYSRWDLWCNWVFLRLESVPRERIELIILTKFASRVERAWIAKRDRSTSWLYIRLVVTVTSSICDAQVPWFVVFTVFGPVLPSRNDPG